MAMSPRARNTYNRRRLAKKALATHGDDVFSDACLRLYVGLFADGRVESPDIRHLKRLLFLEKHEFGTQGPFGQ